MAMRWYARPENHPLQLRVAPRLASWNKADDPDQVRLRVSLDDAESLLADSRIDGPWALRLDVGLPSTRDLLDAADLDNFAYPLAYRLKHPDLVSVWCTKQHSEQSLVRIDAARTIRPPSDVLVARTTASACTVTFKEQIRAAVSGVAEIPAGPVRLELAFVVGPRRNWLNLWKQTIDSLDPLLGRTYPDRAWHPRDGRITELGMHVTVDPAAQWKVAVGIKASAGQTIPSHRLTDPAVGGNSRSEPSHASDGGLNYQELLSELGVGVRGRGPFVFIDDDARYLAWLNTHPDGYVINIARSLNTANARVHRASCRTINPQRGIQQPRAVAWTGPYVKVCADQLADLRQWETDQASKAILPCGTCHPGSAL